MAVDTRNKRSSAIFPLLPFRNSLPLPDGAVDQADRQHVVFLYSGIAASVPSATVPTRFLTLRTRNADINARTRTTDINIRSI